MDKYIVSIKAQEDLVSIWNYTFDTWSERQPDVCYDKIIKTFESICKDSRFDRDYNDIDEDLLGYPVEKHIVFFKRHIDSLVEIVRVLHSGMDIKNRIRE